VAVAVLAAAQASHGARTSPRVGRWQTVRTCQGLVDALRSSMTSPNSFSGHIPERWPGPASSPRSRALEGAAKDSRLDNDARTGDRACPVAFRPFIASGRRGVLTTCDHRAPRKRLLSAATGPASRRALRRAGSFPNRAGDPRETEWWPRCARTLSAAGTRTSPADPSSRS
jgi:hypothetical protein